MKKLISAFVSIVMLLALTVPTFAADFSSTATADSSTATVKTQSQIMPYNVQSFNLQNVGDTYILKEDENGILLIELTDENEIRSNISRAGTTVYTTKSYNVTYSNWLGVDKVAVKITAKATWIDNGSKSYIQSLYGKYSVLNDDFSCAWDDKYTTSSDFVHILKLDIYEGRNKVSYMLSAMMSFIDEECIVPFVLVDIGPTT